MTARRRPRLAILARLVVAVLATVLAWPTFGAACCSVFAQTVPAASTAEADDCCPAQAPEDAGDEHQAPCSCPLSCASGCSGLGRALVPTAACSVAPPGSVPMPRQHSPLADPLPPDPHDILHVPKTVAA